MTGLTFSKLGRSEISIPSLCLGTMMYGDQGDQTLADAQMSACLERGIDFFDTAELYTIPPKPETQGNSERMVGKWIKETGNRDKITLATKIVGRSPMNWFKGRPNGARISPENLRIALENSLKNLDTDYVDLYQLHWPDRKVNLFGGELRGYRHFHDDEFHSFAEILQTVEILQKEGKIREIGVSNETPYGVMKFIAEAEHNGLPRIASIQNCYNLVNRTYELGLAEICMFEDVSMLAYSPIGQGVLSGKYLDGGKPKGSRGEMFGRLDRYETPSSQPAIAAYVQIAKDFGIDPSALAMQFVTTREFVASNIFGASTMAQLDVIFDSLEIEWTKELQDAVTKVHMQYPNVCM